MRLEYKYIIPNSMLNSFRKNLLPFVELDQYCDMSKQKEYTVKSIYFDSKSLEDYSAKVSSLYKRKKIRIRSYNEVDNDSLAFLEIKKKLGSHVYKNRAKISYQKLQKFLETKDLKLLYSQSDEADAEKFLFYYIKNSLKPVTLVTYEREAYFSKHDSSLRITFDKNIRFQKAINLSVLSSNHPSNYSDYDFFVLEIKFDKSFPPWLQEVLRKFNISRKSFSKYSSSVDEIINVHHNNSKNLLNKRNIYA